MLRPWSWLSKSAGLDGRIYISNEADEKIDESKKSV